MSNETFEIWQLVQDESTAQLRWMSSDYLERKGLEMDLANYEQKYRAERKPDDTLGRLFQRFNIERPEDFYGHSLSVSDLIVIRQGAEATVFYVDRFGFKDVTGEIKSVEKLNGQRVMTDPELFQYSGTISSASMIGQVVTSIELFDLNDEQKQAVHLSVDGPLGEYLHKLEWTDCEERYINCDWYYDGNFRLHRIEVPSTEAGKPAKVILEDRSDAQAALRIFGLKEFVNVQHPQPMNYEEELAWIVYKICHQDGNKMEPAQETGKTESSFSDRLAAATVQAEQQNHEVLQPRQQKGLEH